MLSAGLTCLQQLCLQGGFADGAAAALPGWLSQLSQLQHLHLSHAPPLTQAAADAMALSMQALTALTWLNLEHGFRAVVCTGAFRRLRLPRLRHLAGALQRLLAADDEATHTASAHTTSGITSEHVSAEAVGHLAAYPELRVLSLEGSRLSMRVAKALAAVVGKLRCLRQVALSMAHLTSDSLCILERPLGSLSALASLHLERNPFGPGAGSVLQRIIGPSSQLQSLHLAHCGLSDGDCAAVLRALPFGIVEVTLKVGNSPRAETADELQHAYRRCGCLGEVT